MLASLPADMVNQKLADLGIPNRFSLTSSRSSLLPGAKFDRFRLTPRIVQAAENCKVERDLS